MKQINTYLGTVILPLIWMALTGTFTLANFALGFVLSSIAVWLLGSRSEVAFIAYLGRLWRFLGFQAFFIKELVKANLRVAWEVLTPKHHMRPGIIAIPLDAESDLQITILANFITLTPGTLSLDVSPDRKTLYVHAMYVENVDAFRREIKEQLERRVIEVFS
jgi:multicomponent Na+:H+ antiporter subunit E